MSEILHQHRLFCDYSLVFKNNTPRTIQWYKQTFGYFLKATGAQTLSEIDRDLIENYITHGKLQKNWAAKTIRARLCALKLFLDWCVRKELIDTNPVVGFDLPRLPKWGPLRESVI